jgi:hypothetical protein
MTRRAAAADDGTPCHESVRWESRPQRQESATLASAKLVTVVAVLFRQHAKPWNAAPRPELLRDKEGQPRDR